MNVLIKLFLLMPINVPLLNQYFDEFDEFFNFTGFNINNAVDISFGMSTNVANRTNSIYGFPLPIILMMNSLQDGH